MKQKKQYTISTESKYIKEYQNEHYRALVLDENGRKVRFGRRWFLTEEQALREGELLLEELHKAEKLAEYGIHFTRGVFNDENGSGKMMKYGCLIIMVPAALAVTGGIIWDSVFGNSTGFLLSMLIVIAAMVYLFVNQFNYGGNMVSYVLCDGDLYRIFIQNEAAGAAQAVNDFLGSAAALKMIEMGERSRRQSQELLARDSFLHTQLNKNDCWRILEVQKIIKKKGHCIIKCVIEKGKSRRVCRKTLHIREGYNNYRELIGCFEYLEACSSER